MTNIRSLLPGVLLCSIIAIMSAVLAAVEVRLVGQAWLESLVIAILLGAAVRTAWAPPAAYQAGIDYSAKSLLELAIVLMGATTSLAAIAGIGLPLLCAIIITVAIAIIGSYTIGRLVGLPMKMALLIACGNSICGNSAIAAVAPAINADSDDVATSIAFTAVLGIAVVIAVPIIAVHLNLSAVAGGIVAGLTVYAVPQVIAAAGPMGATAVQVGTLVKLTRVLMLGPVVATLSFFVGRRERSDNPANGKVPFTRLVPPFILGFIGLALLNSAGLAPTAMTVPAHWLSNSFTILAMAALGLGVDVRSVVKAGPRVVFVVTASLLLLGGIALVVLAVLGVQ
nr:putative sulfate exporter family transporter [uncultured Sphingomonas sp.]